MKILTIRTDKPEAEIGLYEDTRELSYETWEAHRILAETLLTKIQTVLSSQKLTLKDVQGCVVYGGPGSFTGLRIGVSVANALSYAEGFSIVKGVGDEWVQQGVQRLLNGEDDHIVMPDYGGAVHVSLPKK
jgi:tRNA threonylcarbamoyladenosine biosynthesis protein TsaB